MKKKVLLFLLKRAVRAGMTLFCVISITFFLLRWLPGGPFSEETSLPQEVVAKLARDYSLDQPLWQQYLNYLGKICQGDWGESYSHSGRSVSGLLCEGLPISFQLGFYALVLAYIVGGGLGVLSGQRHRSWSDRLTILLAVSAASIPSFLLAPLLLYVFSIKLGWLPLAFLLSPAHYILPVVTLALRPVALVTRVLRSSMLEISSQDFIRTAQAKGVTHSAIVYRHILKNSLLPILSLAGPMTASLLSGSFIIESMFALPGLGKYFIEGIASRDYPLVLGVTILYSSLLVTSNLLVDVVGSMVDPRIQKT